MFADEPGVVGNRIVDDSPSDRNADRLFGERSCDPGRKMEGRRAMNAQFAVNIMVSWICGNTAGDRRTTALVEKAEFEKRVSVEAARIEWARDERSDHRLQ